MKPFIHPSFWADSDIEEQDAQVKLAALWLITNSQTSILGVCEPSRRRFEFETGLPVEALQRALQGLPKMFQSIGNSVFIKNYIRHQFGSGPALIRNNFFRKMQSVFLGADDEIQKAIIAEYPEFREARKGFARGSQPQGKERIGREGKGKDVPADRFEEFWNGVPNKIGKGEARKAWQKALKVADADTIIAGLKGYRAYESGRVMQRDYRPLHPATWLNQERWTDAQAKAPKSPSELEADRIKALRQRVQPDLENFKKWFAEQYQRDDWEEGLRRESVLSDFLASKGEKP
jgi:hypothetical protein